MVTFGKNAMQFIFRLEILRVFFGVMVIKIGIKFLE